ncbi:hypothetical protein [Confluentibacter lentus]|uniref:hypothetical protein n=1 Tax=Confluentibacter lentus TaxID=1699412 RepID=UPI000C28C7BF|nr:hypothetical protein [Confluentibacter lentus]
MKQIQCKMFGHDFHVTRDVTFHVKEYTCVNCQKQLTTNSNGSLIELTPKFKEINDILERIHHNRMMKKINNKKATNKKGVLIPA